MGLDLFWRIFWMLVMEGLGKAASPPRTSGGFQAFGSCWNCAIQIEEPGIWKHVNRFGKPPGAVHSYALICTHEVSFMQWIHNTISLEMGPPGEFGSPCSRHFWTYNIQCPCQVVQGIIWYDMSLYYIMFYMVLLCCITLENIILYIMDYNSIYIYIHAYLVREY